jgi:hypothetical protein
MTDIDLELIRHLRRHSIIKLTIPELLGDFQVRVGRFFE